MKNKQTIVKRILTILLLFSLFYVSRAQQDCETIKQDIKDFCSNGNCELAQKMYAQLERQCPSYASSVKGLVENCAKKKSTNKPSPQKSPSGYVPTQPLSTGISNREFYFDGNGDCENTTNRLELYWNDWDFLVNEDYQDWLKVERQGNSLLVTCRPNDEMEERNGVITIYGEINTTIKVHQDKRTTSRKSKTRTNYTSQSDSPETKEEQPIIVKIIFEKGKANPKFDNNVGRLITAMLDTNNLVQIEVYKCESQSGIKNLIKAPLIDKRFKEIMEHFANLGIENSRISKNIIVIDGDKNGAECDCAYAKVKIKE